MTSAQRRNYRIIEDATGLDITSALMDYEDGVLDDDETIALFQALVDTGLAWQLQGHYGRIALRMIGAGLVTDSRQTS